MDNYPFTILIVDDNPNNLFTLETLLKRLGNCKVIQAVSGEAALTATLENSIDLILLDIQMPGMDGYETARHLKMTSRTHDIPIIFLTAVFKSEEFIKHGYEVGAVDYLTKPLDDNLFINRVCLYRSLHERENALQDALRQLGRSSEERFRAFFERSLVGMAIISPEKGWLEVNDTLCKTLGYSRKELTRMTWAEITQPEDLEADPAQFNRLLDGGIDGYLMDKRFIHKDGHIIHTRLAVRSVRKEQGGVDYLVVMVEDISERKQNEAELKQYKDHLEELVEQRTTELILACNAAESANKAKSVFLSNMSHELRTPLNAILGFSNMMRKDVQLSASQRQNLDIINRSGEHLLNLINDVLEIAKIESGLVELEEFSFDLGGMVRNVIDMMSMRAKEKGLQLLIDQSSEFPRYIVGDESRLRQVLINLIGNAVKFTQKGGVTIRLGTKTNGIAHLLIEVEDSGPGIAPEYQQKIFESFVQLGEPDVNLGSGLGLTITRQFVAMMKGSLKLESTPGKGSLFRVELPLKETTKTDIIQASGLEKGDVVGLVPGQPEYRILIVEDQLENQLLLVKLMETAGLQFKIAENGEQAVQLFQSWYPHFIWMDRRMPVMNGVEAAKAIRQLPGGKEVKIVAVTASAFMEQRNEMLSAGVDDILRKPYRANEIYNCLARQLGLEFIHEGGQQPEEQIEKFTPEMLAMLPDALCAELKAALDSLDSERIAVVIAQIAAHDTKLQKMLSKLVDNFDYPAILNALDGR